MFVIGELINGMYQNIGNAIKTKDKKVIQKCALEQIASGADALDVNCGPASRQPVSDIQWLVETIQEVTEKPLALDSSKPQVIESGLKVAKNKAIINSTTADPEKLDILVSLAKQYNTKLIGLTISSKGIPQDKAKQINNMIKEKKLKVQTQIQGDQIRVSSKSKDDLQTVIQLLRGANLDIELQFVNYR